MQRYQPSPTNSHPTGLIETLRPRLVCANPKKAIVEGAARPPLYRVIVQLKVDQFPEWALRSTAIHIRAFDRLKDKQ
jgi:hypothetical protein